MLAQPVPYLMKTIWQNQERYNKYWRHIEGCFNTGDMAIQDENGYFKITGRVDDVMKVSGYRISNAELEATLAEHPVVKEVAVIGLPDANKGEKVRAFVVLKNPFGVANALEAVLRDYVDTNLANLSFLTKSNS